MDTKTIHEDPVSCETQFTSLAPSNGKLAPTGQSATAMIRTESTAIVDAPGDKSRSEVTGRTGGAEAPGLFRFSAAGILSVAVPSILSAVLSYMSWTAQTSVQQSIDVNSKYLSTQLSLTQDFYRKKLQAYEETYHNVALLFDALRRADFDVESKNIAMDGLDVLQKSYPLLFKS